jgi:uncharacterized protein with von Willebrand factor type A (vWA) domain
MTMRLFLTVFCCLFALNSWAESCHWVVNTEKLIKKVENGQTYYMFNENLINTSKNGGCFYPVQTAEYIKKLVKDAEDYQKISQDYQQLIEKVEKLNQDYAALIKAHEKTLDRSVNLTEQYNQQVEEYNKLVTDYDALVVKFDELAAGYREVALSTSSFITFDIGAGATSDKGAAGMLGLGIKLGFICQQLKLWGIYQKDNSGGLIGCSYGF